jgi:hypothetical protein
MYTNPSPIPVYKYKTYRYKLEAPPTPGLQDFVHYSWDVINVIMWVLIIIAISESVKIVCKMTDIC